jgi:hypothetical protein
MFLEAEIEAGYNPDPGVTIETVGLEGSYLSDRNLVQRDTPLRRST